MPSHDLTCRFHGKPGARHYAPGELDDCACETPTDGTTTDGSHLPECPTAAAVIVLPEYSADRVSVDLRYLTEALASRGADVSGGFLGGEYGYGACFENDTFAMHPYCWCEQDDCGWCNLCLCPEDAFEYLVNGEPVEFEQWASSDAGSRGTRSVPEKECERCRTGREALPNFLHKPSGSLVRWYKYIGRDMEVDLRAPWSDVLADCLGSLGVSY